MLYIKRAGNTILFLSDDPSAVTLSFNKFVFQHVMYGVQSQGCWLSFSQGCIEQFQGTDRCVHLLFVPMKERVMVYNSHMPAEEPVWPVQAKNKLTLFAIGWALLILTCVDQNFTFWDYFKKKKKKGAQSTLHAIFLWRLWTIFHPFWLDSPKE